MQKYFSNLYFESKKKKNQHFKEEGEGKRRKVERRRKSEEGKKGKWGKGRKVEGEREEKGEIVGGRWGGIETTMIRVQTDVLCFIEIFKYISLVFDLFCMDLNQKFLVLFE